MPIAGNPDVFARFDIYRAFMSTMPFFGLMALSAILAATLGEIDLSFPSVLGNSPWVLGRVFVASGSFLLALAASTACWLPWPVCSSPAR